jgi:hypothetical protein
MERDDSTVLAYGVGTGLALLLGIVLAVATGALGLVAALPLLWVVGLAWQGHQRRVRQAKASRAAERLWHLSVFGQPPEGWEDE